MFETNKAQADYWASAAGRKWIELEHALDTAMAGMLDIVLDAASITQSDHIIDVGCGTGVSTIEAARTAGNGMATGVDISEQLLERARERSSASGIDNISYLFADAQTHKFGVSVFDVLISRVGMSFFEDSAVAMENLKKSMRKNGRMAFVSWASVSKNPWFKIPKGAAENRLGSLPKSDPNAPGPTAFQDLERVAGLMKVAGLKNIESQSVDFFLTPPNGISGAASTSSKVGPAARIMKHFDGTSSDASAIEEAVAEEMSPFESDGVVRVPAVLNLFTCST
jgi:SAM-dependent methyltransferase